MIGERSDRALRELRFVAECCDELCHLGAGRSEIRERRGDVVPMVDAIERRRELARGFARGQTGRQWPLGELGRRCFDVRVQLRVAGELAAVMRDARQRCFEAVDRSANRRGRRVDLVRDAGDEQAEAGHALRQHELRLGIAQISERPAELAVDRGELDRT